MPYKQVMFSEAKIELHRELAKHHPKLAALVNAHGAGEEHWAAKVGEVAAAFNIVMDGVYNAEDMDRICHDLVMRLRDARTIQVIGIDPGKDEGSVTGIVTVENGEVTNIEEVDSDE